MNAGSIGELKPCLKHLVRHHIEGQGLHSLLVENLMKTVLNTY